MCRCGRGYEGQEPFCPQCPQAQRELGESNESKGQVHGFEWNGNRLVGFKESEAGQIGKVSVRGTLSGRSPLVLERR